MGSSEVVLYRMPFVEIGHSKEVYQRYRDPAAKILAAADTAHSFSSCGGVGQRGCEASFGRVF